MAKNKIELLRRLREIATKELDALPETLALLNAEKRAAVAIKLLSLTMDNRDIYSDDDAHDFWGNLPSSKKEAETAKP